MIGETHVLNADGEMISTWFMEETVNTAIVMARPPAGCALLHRTLLADYALTHGGGFDLLELLLKVPSEQIQIVARTLCRLPRATNHVIRPKGIKRIFAILSQSIRHRKRVAPWRVLERAIRKPVHKFRRRYLKRWYS